MEQYIDSSVLIEILAKVPGNQVIWEQFLEYLSNLVECENSYILITDVVQREKTHFLFSFNISEEQQNLYTGELNKLDNFNFLLAKNLRQVFCNQNVQSTVKNDSIDNPGFQYRFGFAIPCNTHHSLNLYVNRTLPFSMQERQHISTLLQSIITPLENAMRAELQQKIYSQILHHTHESIDGYVIIDHSLNILFSDAIYTSVIEKFHCINITDNHIEFNNPDIRQRLLFLMDNNFVASIHNQCNTCQITLIPVAMLDNLYDWECFNQGFILTFTHDKQNNPIIERLTNIHNLSKCEALYALDFMLTPSIAEIAENNFRSEETIRNHIKHIMQKMDVHSQAALMKKLIGLAVL